MDSHNINDDYFTNTLQSDNSFRNYTDASIDENIRNTYKLARTYQSIDYVRHMHQKYLTFQQLDCYCMKEKDDLSDSFLQGLYVLHQHVLKGK